MPHSYFICSSYPVVATGNNIKTMQTDTTNTSDAQIATNVSSANKNDDGPPNASPSTNTTTSAAPAPRAKINISLKKKSKPKKSSNNNNSLQKQQLNTNGATSLLADEYSTIAEEAEIISQRRKEQGSVLVIPCKQSTNEEDKRKQPLLAGRLALLRKGEGEEDGESTTAAVESNIVDNKSEVGGTNNGIPSNNENTDTVDDEAMKELIQSAEQRDNTKHDTNDKAAATSHGRGLVIAAPSENKLTTRTTADTNSNTTTSKTIHGRNEIMNDEEVFKHELSHHAPDVDPTSNVYANISIGDFGSALLRGMGWTGGSSSASTNNNNKQLGGGGGKDDEIVKPRPHRLGLGAKPLPLPSTSTTSSSKARSSGGIHRRARRPEDVKRDEERLRQQEEAEKILEEKKKLDVQYTLQNGSIVAVREDIIADTLNGGDKQNSGTRRALILQTAGVPGLNRILIQLEGEQKGISVTKNSVSLCSWEELEKHPFKKTPLMKEKKKGEQSSGKKEEREYGRNGARKRDRSYSDDDNGGRYDERRRKDDRRRDHKHYSEEEEKDDDPRDDDSYNFRRSSKKHKRRKKDRRSRSRSDSRERRSDGRRRKDSRKDRRRDRSRSPEEQRKRSKHHDLYHSSPHNHHQQQLHWLIPHIRVRLISKKIPKYYLQKGIIQDVMQPTQSSSSSSGPKAVILMENGQVLDKVPERYLETALPKAGGHVIILESKDESHHWKKGRLLEKSSKDGYGIIQLEEDLEVVKVSLDGIAEWCGDQLE